MSVRKIVRFRLSRLLSNASDPTSFAKKQLLKKFKFQVHPDYFQFDKKMANVNTVNLNILENVISGVNVDENDGNGSQQGARTLTFFIKPTDDMPTPKKMKVSLKTPVESMINILEMLGIEDIPFIAKDVSHNSKLVRGNLNDLYDFLDNLLDAKELISWRFERHQALLALEEQIRVMTGVYSIEYRISWSSHNKIVLLSRLWNTLLEFRKIEKDMAISADDTVGKNFPWTGFKLIVFDEDSLPAHQYVDYSEGYIYLNTSHQPLQWIAMFHTIVPERVALRRKLLQEVEKYKHLFLARCSAVCQTVSPDQPAAAGGVPSGDIAFALQQGRTCSLLEFHYFLERMAKDAGTMGLEAGQNGQHSSDTHITQPKDQIQLVIERSHGTKLLSDGTYRIDAVTSQWPAVASMLQTQLSASLSRIRRRNQMQTDMTEVKTQLMEHLHMQSIEPLIGVNDARFMHCLRSMRAAFAQYNAGDVFSNASSDGSYQRRASNPWLNLRDQRVLIGYYLGIADDGACIIPWSFLGDDSDGVANDGR